jgi:iron complex outermembrane receptor protein
MRPLAPIVCLLGLALASASATARAETLQAIDVTASGDSADSVLESRTGEVVASESTAATSSIARETLQRPGAELGRLIAHEVGASLRESGGLGSFSEISLRGASSEQVLVFLDGLLLNEASGGGVNLSDIELAQAAQVDIYRGTTPGQFGQASLGGAVNIRSARLDGGEQTRVSLGAGSFGAFSLSGMTGGARDDWDWLATASHREADNDFSFVNDNGTSFNSADDREEKRHNAQTETDSGLFKLGRELGDGLYASGLLQLLDKSQGIPSWNNAETSRTRLDTRRWQLRGQLRAQAVADSQWNSVGSVYASNQRELYDDRASQVGLGAQYSEGETRVLGAENYWERVADSHTFSAKIDLRREDYIDRDLRGIDPTERQRRDTLSLAVQDSAFLLDERLLLTPALRYSHRWDHFESQQLDDGDFSPQLGARFAISEQLSLQANAGRYVRAPSFFELFGDRGLFLGNDELTPETSTNLDASLQWRSAERAVTAEIGGFYNRVEDLIARVYDARGVGKSQNIADARIVGLELALKAELAERWSLTANATLQDPLNRSQVAAFYGKRLPGRASESGYLRLDYRRSGLNLFYELDAEAGIYYDSANLLPAEDRLLHNLGASYPLGDFLLSVELHNASDEQYEDFNGFPKPGRSLFASLSWPAASDNQAK